MANRWKDNEFRLPDTIIKSEHMGHGELKGAGDMLNDSFHGYNVVIEFIKSLLKQLKKEEKSSWCDPDFGPTDTD